MEKVTNCTYCISCKTVLDSCSKELYHLKECAQATRQFVQIEVFKCDKLINITPTCCSCCELFDNGTHQDCEKNGMCSVKLKKLKCNLWGAVGRHNAAIKANLHLKAFCKHMISCKVVLSRLEDNKQLFEELKVPSHDLMRLCKKFERDDRNDMISCEVVLLRLEDNKRLFKDLKVSSHDLKRLRKKVKGDDRKQYKCKLCNFSCRSNHLLMQHFENRHTSDINAKVSVDPPTKNRHTSDINANVKMLPLEVMYSGRMPMFLGSILWKCYICFKVVNALSLYKTHMLEDHCQPSESILTKTIVSDLDPSILKINIKNAAEFHLILTPTSFLLDGAGFQPEACITSSEPDRQSEPSNKGLKRKRGSNDSKSMEGAKRMKMDQSPPTKHCNMKMTEPVMCFVKEVNSDAAQSQSCLHKNVSSKKSKKVKESKKIFKRTAEDKLSRRVSTYNLRNKEKKRDLNRFLQTVQSGGTSANSTLTENFVNQDDSKAKHTNQTIQNKITLSNTSNSNVIDYSIKATEYKSQTNSNIKLKYESPIRHKMSEHVIEMLMESTVKYVKSTDVTEKESLYQSQTYKTRIMNIGQFLHKKPITTIVERKCFINNISCCQKIKREQADTKTSQEKTISTDIKKSPKALDSKDFLKKYLKPNIKQYELDTSNILKKELRPLTLGKLLKHKDYSKNHNDITDKATVETPEGSVRKVSDKEAAEIPNCDVNTSKTKKILYSSQQIDIKVQNWNESQRTRSYGSYIIHLGSPSIIKYGLVEKSNIRRYLKLCEMRKIKVVGNSNLSKLNETQTIAVMQHKLQRCVGKYIPSTEDASSNIKCNSQNKLACFAQMQNNKTLKRKRSWIELDENCSSQKRLCKSQPNTSCTVEILNSKKFPTNKPTDFFAEENNEYKSIHIQNETVQNCLKYQEKKLYFQNRIVANNSYVNCTRSVEASTRHSFKTQYIKPLCKDIQNSNILGTVYKYTKFPLVLGNLESYELTRSLFQSLVKLPEKKIYFLHEQSKNQLHILLETSDSTYNSTCQPSENFDEYANEGELIRSKNKREKIILNFYGILKAMLNLLQQCTYTPNCIMSNISMVSESINEAEIIKCYVGKRLSFTIEATDVIKQYFTSCTPNAWSCYDDQKQFDRKFELLEKSNRKSNWMPKCTSEKNGLFIDLLKPNVEIVICPVMSSKENIFKYYQTCVKVCHIHKEENLCYVTKANDNNLRSIQNFKKIETTQSTKLSKKGRENSFVMPIFNWDQHIMYKNSKIFKNDKVHEKQREQVIDVNTQMVNRNNIDSNVGLIHQNEIFLEKRLWMKQIKTNKMKYNHKVSSRLQKQRAPTSLYSKFKKIGMRKATPIKQCKRKYICTKRFTACNYKSQCKQHPTENFQNSEKKKDNLSTGCTYGKLSCVFENIEFSDNCPSLTASSREKINFPYEENQKQYIAVSNLREIPILLDSKLLVKLLKECNNTYSFTHERCSKNSIEEYAKKRMLVNFNSKTTNFNNLLFSDILKELLQKVLQQHMCLPNSEVSNVLIHGSQNKYNNPMKVYSLDQSFIWKIEATYGLSNEICFTFCNPVATDKIWDFCNVAKYFSKENELFAKIHCKMFFGGDKSYNILKNGSQENKIVNINLLDTVSQLSNSSIAQELIIKILVPKFHILGHDYKNRMGKVTSKCQIPSSDKKLVREFLFEESFGLTVADGFHEQAVKSSTVHSGEYDDLKTNSGSSFSSCLNIERKKFFKSYPGIPFVMEQSKRCSRGLEWYENCFIKSAAQKKAWDFRNMFS